MNLDYLEYIVAIADKGSISRAAENLHISQPTLSIYLGKLEKQLNLKLFIRANNVLTITDAGIKYVNTCREILKLRDRLYKELYPQKQNKIRIGVLSSSTPVFKKVLKEFKTQHPQVSLYPLIKKSEEIYQALLKGDIDMGFVTSYAEKPETQFPEAKCRVLQKYELMLCIAQSNPLCEKLELTEGILKEEDYRLLESGHLMRSNVSMIRQRIDENILPTLGIRPMEYISADDNIEFFTSTLDIENVYSFIPFSRLPEEFIQLALPFHPHVYKLAICRKNTHLNEMQKHFLEQISEVFHESRYYYHL